MLAGLALLVPATRKVAILILVIMHFFILVLLGPAGVNINAVIWPWNILMPLSLFILFYKNSFIYEKAFMRNRFSLVVVLCWCILPWLQLAGMWDKYLSAVLYSGGVPQLYICTENSEARQNLGNYMDDSFWVIPCSPVLSTYSWGMREMNTAPYPEPRIYKRIIEAWKTKYPGKTSFYLFTPGFAPKLEKLDGY